MEIEKVTIRKTPDFDTLDFTKEAALASLILDDNKLCIDKLKNVSCG